jgi:hypothetical protein
MRRAAVLTSMTLVVLAAHADRGHVPLVTFAKLHRSYTAGSRITFTVTSRIPAAVEFSCTAEVLHDGAWREALYSVNGNPRSKSVPLLPLEGTGASQRITWDTAATSRYTPPGTYRLKVEVFESGRVESLGTTLSSPFMLVKKQPSVPPN